jgi:hypothetical protein
MRGMEIEALAPEHARLMRRSPPSAASHRERILAVMRRRAETEHPWVCGEDFRERTCDGHAPIANITPRISEIRRSHEILAERDPDTGCARYRLLTDGSDSTPPFDEIVAEPVDDTREQLALELSPAAPTSYDPGSEWA